MHLRDRLYAFLSADELAHNAHNARRDKMASSTSPLPIIDKIGNAGTHIRKQDKHEYQSISIKIQWKYRAFSKKNAS